MYINMCCDNDNDNDNEINFYLDTSKYITTSNIIILMCNITNNLT